MKICVIGAGAMGSLFGALLYAAGHQVGLLETQQSHIEAVRRNQGLVLEENGQTRVVPCPVSSRAEDFAGSDLCLVFVKSAHTAQAALSAARCLNENGLALTLQNGLGNADILAGQVNRVLAGYTSMAALLLEPGVVRHTGKGATALGPWIGATANDARRMADVLSRANIPATVLDDVRAAIWDKLFVNIGINALGAILGITNGQVGSHPETRALAAKAMEEARQVALSLRVPVRENLFDHFLEVCNLTAHNYCSMLQDLQRNRQTEVDFIHGAVSRLGREQNIPTPVNDVLAALVRTAQFYNLEGENK